MLSHTHSSPPACGRPVETVRHGRVQSICHQTRPSPTTGTNPDSPLTPYHRCTGGPPEGHVSTTETRSVGNEEPRLRWQHRLGREGTKESPWGSRQPEWTGVFPSPLGWVGGEGKYLELSHRDDTWGRNTHRELTGPLVSDKPQPPRELWTLM